MEEGPGVDEDAMEDLVLQRLGVVRARILVQIPREAAQVDLIRCAAVPGDLVGPVEPTVQAAAKDKRHRDHRH
jgi:hypothetical protein